MTDNSASDSDVDLAVDHRGIPHLVYQRSGKIYYKYGLGVEILIGDGSLPAIAVDSDAAPHIVFVAGGQVQYVSRSGRIWRPAVFISDGGGTSPNIDIGPGGFVHIAYLKKDALVSDLYYAHNKNGNFVNALKATTGPWNPRITSSFDLAGIKIDGAGSYHIVYLNNYSVMGIPSNGIVEISNQSGADVSTDLSTGLMQARFSRNSVAVDGNGAVHIAYCENTTFYRARLTDGWQRAAVQTVTNPPLDLASIAAKNGMVGIVYPDDSGTLQLVNDAGSGFGQPVPVDTGKSSVVSLGSAYVLYIKSDGQDDEVYLKADRNLDEHLVGYWKFDTASDLGRDSSSYGNHGIVATSDVSFLPAGKIGGCAKFIEGTPDAAIEVPNGASLDITSGITIAAWIKRDGIDTDGGDAVLSKGRSGTSEQYGLYADHPAAQSQTLACFTGGSAASGKAMNPGSWYHVAMTYDGVTCKIYENGSLVATKPVPGGLVSNTSSLFIGASPMPNPEDYSGTLDEIKIYDMVLGQSEIQSWYADNPLALVISRSSLVFGAVVGGTSTTSQSVVVSNTGPGTLAWTATPSAAWITPTPGSGAGAGTVMIGVDPTGLAAGTYSGTVAFTDSAATNSPQAVTVNLTVYAVGGTLPPFGDFATPIDGTINVTGAIPVTGWVLDDVGMSKLEIWRDPVLSAGEVNSLYFIGNGLFVEGPRPDIETGYPNYPMNYVAGWGYMLLTNFLPNQGNGTYKLYAIATDKEGNQVTLGTKTITCDNAHAVKPFGTIDTPGQGGTASGNKYVNFGWVLTPLPGTVPKDGHLITVYVDSVLRGNLSTPPNLYNAYRSDVSTNFPGLNNTGGPGAGQGGPIGAFFLDTTGFANGVHTIFWIAYDDLGQGEGIGSRYFSIANVAGAPEPAPAAQEAAQGELSALPISFSPLPVRTGFDLKAKFLPRYPNSKGVVRIEIPEVNWIEIELGETPEAAAFKSGGARFSGHMVVGKEFRRLPIGSSLDRRSGRFSWMPGPGFLGDYRLVFIEDHEGVRRITNVLVCIKPRQ